MRRLLLLLLALLLPLNAAAAAVSALGDAVEHAGQSHHHHGDDSGDIDHHDHDVDLDGESQAPHAKDHCHAHPGFSSVPPSPLTLHLPPAFRERIVAPTMANIAAPPSRLERPPRPHPVA